MVQGWEAGGGVIIMDSSSKEEKEQMQEDKEVEKLMKEGDETKRKILTGMSNVLDTVQNITIVFMTSMLNMSNWMYLFIIVVRTVAEGHQMVADGHNTVAQGWKLFWGGGGGLRTWWFATTPVAGYRQNDADNTTTTLTDGS